MTRAIAVALSITLGLLAPPAAWAQEGPELASAAVGARVRVTAPDGSWEFFGLRKRRFIGRLLSADEESLKLELPGHDDPLVIPRSSVQGLEVSRARSKRSKGAAIGLLIGSAIVAAYYLALLDAYDAHCDTSCIGTGALAVVVSGALPGALLGAAVAPGEKWEDASADEPSVRVGIGPAPGGGVGLGLQWSFGARPRRARLVGRPLVPPSPEGPPRPASLRGTSD